MAISIDSTMANYMATQATATQKDLTKTSQATTPEEAKEAIKEFEKYFVEQMLKQMEEEFKDDKATFSQLTNMFMDQVNEKLADQLVDQSGSRLTQTLFEQMCRNYNIPLADDVKPGVVEEEKETIVENVDAGNDTGIVD